MWGCAETKCPMAPGEVVVSFGIGQGREQRQRYDNCCLTNILRPTSETLRTLISGPSAGVSQLIVCETLRGALRNASNVESQESCIHPMLSHTSRARPVLRCSPF